MKKKVLFLMLLCGALLAQRRYYHESGDAILRVDERYPGAFVEHRTISTGADNLFRAFFAFGSDDGGMAYGSAHEYPPLFEGTFSLTDSLRILEFYYTVIDTDSTGAPVDTDSVLVRTETSISYSDIVFGIALQQRIWAIPDSGTYIPVELVITNIRGTRIDGLRAVFFYDGDVPDFSYHDDYPLGFDYLDAAAVRDGTTNFCAGFASLLHTPAMSLGARFEWVSDTITPDTANMRSLIYDSPAMPSAPISPGDWSVYGIWEPFDLAAGAVETLQIAFLLASNSSDFEAKAASVRGDSVHPFIADVKPPKTPRLEIAPNPFNAKCRIRLEPSEDTKVEIYDIAGRLVAEIEAGQASEVYWDGKGSIGEFLPNGVYLLKAVSRLGCSPCATVVLLK